MKLTAEMKVMFISLNMEKAGEGDGKLLHNIKLKSQLQIEQMKRLFATDVGYEFAVSNFYRKDGELVTRDLGWVELDRQGVGVTASLKTEHGILLEWTDGANFNKISYKLLAGKQVEIEARLQVHLDEGQADDLNKMFGAGVTVKVSAKKSQIEDAATREAEERQQKLDVEPADRKEGDKAGSKLQ